MIRRFGTGGLKRKKSSEEDPSPMWGVSNMSDVMLVLAVGIMLALVANWKLSVFSGAVTTLDVDSGVVEELENFTSVEDDEMAEKIRNSKLEELGSVYVDPDTGKMYVIVAEEGVTE